MDSKKNKVKDDSDDTSSVEGQEKPTDDFIVSATRARRDRRKRYKNFRKENKQFWMWFNFLVSFFSVGFMVGTYLILDNSQQDCSNLTMSLYLVVCLHALNVIMSLVNLCGVETKICNQNMVCCIVLFEVTMLVLMQVTYFSSQYNNCLKTSPDLYFWTMGQILAFYMGLTVVICHFFRKFCHDPNLSIKKEDSAEKNEDQKATDLEAPEETKKDEDK